MMIVLVVKMVMMIKIRVVDKKEGIGDRKRGKAGRRS